VSVLYHELTAFEPVAAALDQGVVLLDQLAPLACLGRDALQRASNAS
jgi:hypothetical protein